jgi:3-methyl-2-oxobutanoate hydroxymethyltransferase
MARPSFPGRFAAMKKRGEKIAMITASDYASAGVTLDAGADITLVGDSLGFTTLGYSSMAEVTLDDMIHHLMAVKRGSGKSFVLCDMPINTYKTPGTALRNAKKLIHAGAHAIKIEGCIPGIVKALAGEGMPVMGHIGLTPQTLTRYRVQGNRPGEAERIREGALALEHAGCFALLLELVAAPLAGEITRLLRIPTVGIGSGIGCDGQVLVYNDLLGIFDRFKPKFVRHYKELRIEMVNGCRNFIRDVKTGRYPSKAESYC